MPAFRAGTSRGKSDLSRPPRQDFCAYALPAVFGDGLSKGTRAGMPGPYAAAGASSISAATSRVLAGSMWIPGPIVDVSVIDSM